MSTTVQLTEWRPTEVWLPPTVVQGLLAAHGRHLSVTPTDRADVWLLRPSSTVGTFRVDDHRFLIRTKVALPNLLAMMDVPISSEVVSPDAVDLAADEDLQHAIVRLFCVAVEATTAAASAVTTSDRRNDCSHLGDASTCARSCDALVSTRPSPACTTITPLTRR